MTLVQLVVSAKESRELVGMRSVGIGVDREGEESVMCQLCSTGRRANILTLEDGMICGVGRCDPEKRNMT